MHLTLVKTTNLSFRYTQVLQPRCFSNWKVPGGPPVEKIANIGLVNQWQEYSFDFSAAKDYKHLKKQFCF